MARYRKISTRIWNDSKFTTLPDDSKLAFFFVLTHPHMTPLGAMRATVEGMAAELGWLPERLREAFRKAIGKGVLTIDEDAKCVFLPNFIKHNLPESPNVIIAWERAADDIPECELKSLALQAVMDQVKDMPEAFRRVAGRLSKAFPKGMANQEQEQEYKDIRINTEEKDKIQKTKDKMHAASAAAPEKRRRVKTELDDQPWTAEVVPLPHAGEFDRVWREWVAVRAAKGKRHTLTNRQARLAIERIRSAGLSLAEATECVFASAAGGWDGIFPDRVTGNRRAKNHPTVTFKTAEAVAVQDNLAREIEEAKAREAAMLNTQKPLAIPE